MIKNFTIQKIYNDVDSLKEHVKYLEFKESTFGEQTEFNMLQDNLKSLLNSFSPALEVNEDSGFFRKPYNIIHCEDVPEGRIYVGICPLENAKITFLKHLETNSENAFEINVPVSEIFEDIIYPEKFEETQVINVKAGEIFFFSPALWHKVECSLAQIFYLDVKQRNKKDTNSTNSTKDTNEN